MNNSKEIPKLIVFFEEELKRILTFWEEKGVDEQNGGFYGQINHFGIPNPNADKAIILNSRILWAFSAAYLHNPDKAYIEMADRAYNYLSSYFTDKKHGGVYWTLNNNGNPINKRKQVYAQAFTIYAYSEYYKIDKKPEALESAIAIFNLLEQYSFDKDKLGYIEAFDEKWQSMDDVRLSEKDDNEKKTMNTHLHVLEAYSNLYKVWPNATLKTALEKLIEVFLKYMINEKGHLNLFFDEDWNLHSQKVSFGHEIETAWLIMEAMQNFDDAPLFQKVQDSAIALAKASEEGLDSDGGLMNEYDPEHDHLDGDKHWWPQAEAMVGYLNTYLITEDETYWKHFTNAVNFTSENIIDKEYGEWLWKVDKNRKHTPDEKAGAWKCPYHNLRACLEVLHRLNILQKQNS